MNYFDLIGTILSLIGTFYFVKANIRMWPIYILAALINSMLYINYKMYASFLLENMYLVISIYGWYFWKNTNLDYEVDIKKISNTQLIILSIIWFLSFLFIYFLMVTFTDTTFPIIEALAVGSSLVAQALSSRKIIECWYVWIVADSIFIVLMFQQSLYFHSLLFFCYLILAIIGLLNWTKLRSFDLQKKLLA